MPAKNVSGRRRRYSIRGLRRVFDCNAWMYRKSSNKRRVAGGVFADCSNKRRGRLLEDLRYSASKSAVVSTDNRVSFDLYVLTVTVWNV